MLTIRLARSGAKKRPFYHISVADSRMPRDGRFVERVGYYNPIASGQEVRLEVDVERIDYWISKGAQPSERVLNLLKQNTETPEQTEKRLAAKEAKRIKKLALKVAAKEAEAAPAAEEAAAEEAPAEEAAPEEAPAEEAAPEEAPAEEAPAEEAAPEEAPAEEAPAEEAAPEEAPAKEEDEDKSS
jgi:small subunit ribosomal protein S16